MQTLSTDGVKFIDFWEGVKLKPYQDSGGRWTIGRGHLIGPGEGWMMAGITQQQADELWAKDAAWAINEANNDYDVALRQNQFDALVSFIFNTGGSDTLRRLINSGSSEAAIRDWWENHYITVNVNGVHKKVTGLVNRRKAEADFFFGESLQSVIVKASIKNNYIAVLAITFIITLLTYLLTKQLAK